MARIRGLLANRNLVGALAVVFVMLLAGIVLAGQGTDITQPPPPTGIDVGGAVPSPTVTAVVIRNTTTPAPSTTRRSTVPGASNATNASGNVTPVPYETVLVVKTLDRYIQNAGGDPGSQLRTPAPPATPTSPSPVPTSASGSSGPLSWSGEGTYVTEPFALDAGTIRVEMTAGVLTMAQLRDAAGTAIGIATAGPQPATTEIRVPAAGTYRLEVWPFGSGPWTITISNPTAAPTLAPVSIVTTAGPTTGAETTAPTTLETLTAATTEPTATPTPMQTQETRTFAYEGTDNGTQALGPFKLYEGLATFTYSTTASGTFSITLVGDGETVLVAPTEGPLKGSKGVVVPATGQYLLNVAGSGPWRVSIA